VIVLVALLHAATIEALGDDRIGHAEPEQFGILNMTKMVRIKAKSAVLRPLAIASALTAPMMVLFSFLPHRLGRRRCGEIMAMALRSR
jgi:hypothetical protein